MRKKKKKLENISKFSGNSDNNRSIRKTLKKHGLTKYSDKIIKRTLIGRFFSLNH